MGLFNQHWLDEGYYEDDGYGDMTKITDKDEISRAKKENKLFRHDGYSLNKVEKYEDLNSACDE